jgi:hypothetical protein
MFAWWILFGCTVGTQVCASAPSPSLRPGSADDYRIESFLNPKEQGSSYRSKLARYFERNLQMPYKLLCYGYMGMESFHVNLFIFTN